jgi:hypothetical protein
MKSIMHGMLVLLLLTSLTSCLRDKCTETAEYTYYKPVYVTPEEYKIPVSLTAEIPLQEPGKIYFYKEYILINEVRKGIHVILNTDPKNPVNLGFIQIPGNVDMAVMNNVLYADSYTDLLVINISNPLQPVELERKENVFESFYFSEGSNRILSHFEETDVTQTFDCSSSHFGNGFFMAEDGGAFFDSFSGTGGILNSSSNGTPVVGQGGSLARFTISKSHLYAVGEAQIFTLPIISGGYTGDLSTTQLPWGIETIFPFKNYLFLGANNGMHILDIENPTHPELLSSFTHARACDPVVVDDNTAYVTLRTGEFSCPGDKNELQVIDVKDVFKPELIATFPMENPNGLGFFDEQLYICEGKSGLKIFDKSNPLTIGQKLLARITDISAKDVIAVRKNLLLLIGDDGFYQYDTSDSDNIILLSKIPVTK